MSLTPGCPRCPTAVRRHDGAWTCEDHGPTVPLWRPAEASYDTFAEHLLTAGPFPTYLPWPLGPGWQVSDFAVAAEGPDGAEGPGPARATVTCTTGSTDPDGPVDVIVVAEEPGTGVGARVAGTGGVDPGDGIGDGPPTARVRIGHKPVPLWAVSTSGIDPELDRFVVAGEADGRWLWMVLRPASAVLLLRDEWILRDVAGLGPAMVETRFGGPPPPW